jgi:signal transduction histidine kinase
MWTTIARGSVWTGRLSNRRKDGSLYEEEMSISPVRDENGTIINYVAVKRDVTRELELQQQLAQAQKMEAIGRLAGGVAHDFNNLLQALISHVQLLRSRSNDPEKVEASSREMEQLIGHGASLTRQLLLFSRRETVKPERLDLNEQVREASKMLQRVVKDNIALRIELAPQHLHIDADRGQLDQVLMNLVVNASDAMPDGGQITIRTGATNRTRVWLSVKDTGVGIPEEIRERIFEPFFTTKGAGKGTGLGLSVVHGIVTRHGGQIEVESELGRGATFRVSLPAAGSGEFPAAKEASQETADLPVGKGERVLVVEDEELARKGLHEILASFNYKVVSVGSGEAAGSLPADPPFDLLLTDLMLPGVAGPQLAAGLKERWPELKVILMSGYTEDETIRSGVGDGTLRFLQKPFDMAALAREVRAALDE